MKRISSCFCFFTFVHACCTLPLLVSEAFSDWFAQVGVSCISEESMNLSQSITTTREILIIDLPPNGLRPLHAV